MTKNNKNNFMVLSQVESGQPINKIKLEDNDLIDCGNINDFLINGFKKNNNYLVAVSEKTYNNLKFKGYLRKP